MTDKEIGDELHKRAKSLWDLCQREDIPLFIAIDAKTKDPCTYYHIGAHHLDGMDWDNPRSGDVKINLFRLHMIFMNFIVRFAPLFPQPKNFKDENTDIKA